MDLLLRDKVVFVAGGSRGIGFEIARGFLGEGAKVAITGRNPGSLNAAFESLCSAFSPNSVFSFSGDMSRTEDIISGLDTVEAALGPIEIAVANVGGGSQVADADFSDAVWEDALQQNLMASVRLLRAMGMRLRRRPAENRGDGSLVAVSSIAGLRALGPLRGVENMEPVFAYGASKAALTHWVRNFARELGHHGIRVNAVAPGNIIFDGSTWERMIEAQPEIWLPWIEREVALQRLGTAEEIADAVVFVASPRAGFVSGECFVVDGGQVCN